MFLGVFGEGSAQEGKEGSDILFELEAWILISIVPNCASSEDDAFWLFARGFIKFKAWKTLQDYGVPSSLELKKDESEISIMLFALAWLLQNSRIF